MSKPTETTAKEHLPVEGEGQAVGDEKAEPAGIEDGTKSTISSLEDEKLHDQEENPAPVEQVRSNDEQKYPSAKAMAAIIPALLLSVFLMALDRTIIATAIPRITDSFNSLGDVGWYGSSYLLTFSAFQLLFGRIYTFYNPKWVILAAIFIFEVGSAVCGAAPTSIALIVGRAISGLGASGILGGAVVILIHSVPLHKRPLYQGMIGGVFGVSSVVGPLLGGVFTSKVSWRWCFYINLPIGGVAMAIIAVILHLDFPRKDRLTLREQASRLDPIGTAIFLPGIICILLALQWGGSTYAWSNWRIILLIILFGILMIIFGWVQKWKGDYATVPLRIIKNRSIIAAVWYSTCYGGAMMVLIYYLPIWFQAIKGSSPVHSGIQNLAAVLSLVVASIMSGVIVHRIGYYKPNMIASSIISSIGAGMLTTFQVDTRHDKWIGYQFLWGFGFGLGMQQPGLAAQVALPKIDAPTGIALTFFGQTMGGAIFIAVGQNILSNKLVEGLRQLNIRTISPDAIVKTGATELRSFVSSRDLPLILKVYNKALVNNFYVAVGLSAASIIGALLIEWKSVKKDKKNAKPKDEENTAS